ncbi:MAG: hypothetical protein NTZ12_00480 [Candidatus Aminicenantes bacterium]|nr:hypothetical protein [Candidatus Aminicenantes bacterium]
MSIKEEGKIAAEKSSVNENKKNLVAESPAPFPLFPFGTFLLPLFIPCPQPTEGKKKD